MKCGELSVRTFSMGYGLHISNEIDGSFLISITNYVDILGPLLAQSLLRYVHE